MTALAPVIEGPVPQASALKSGLSLSKVLIGLALVAATVVLLTSKADSSGSLRQTFGAISLAFLAANMAQVSWRRQVITAELWFAGALLLSWAVALLAGGHFKLSSAMQQAMLPVALFAARHCYGEIPKRVARCVGALVVLVAGWHALVDPAIVVGGIPRPAGFFEAIGIHNSAYVLLAALAVLLSAEPNSKIATLALFAIGAVLLVLYQVRTVWLMIAIAALSLLASRANARTVFASTSIAVSLVGFVLLNAASHGFDANSFSSGRLQNYLERLSLIVDRPLISVVFGSGAGTDAYRTAIWWWAEKNSHNDFLTVAIERGVFGLLVLLAYGFVVVRGVSKKPMAILVMVVVASFVSNGLLARPMPMLLMSMALGLSFASFASASSSADLLRAPSSALSGRIRR